MKIALLTDGIYPYVLGGMQKHSYYLAKYLARHQVSVDLYHTGSEAADTKQLKEFSQEELAYITPQYVPFPSVGKLPGHYVLESYLYSVQVYQRLKEAAPVDFIYAQGFTGWKTVIEKKKDKTLPPVAVNFHGVEMFQQAPNFQVKLQHLLLQPPVKFILQNADYVVSLGGKLTAIQRSITTKKIIEMPIGIEAGWLTQEVAEKELAARRFVFVGRYERRKGVEELHSALEKLLDKYNFNFSFIGPIPVAKHLKHPKITYFGLVKEEAAIKKILAAADVLVCPSYSEGMPTVILEAMASGLAVVATDVGAVSALVSDNTGWLLSPGDEAALRQALIKAISCSETELHTKQQKAQALIQSKYTWDKVIASTITQITALVQ